MFEIESTLHIIWIFFVIAGTLYCYAREISSIEMVSMVTLVTLLLTYSIFPVYDESGMQILSPTALLAGFASPALITVLALLIMGEGIVRTGLLDRLALLSGRLSKTHIWILLPLLLVAIFLVSAFLNNVPVVVLAIPVIQGILKRLNKSPSKYMMLVSYSAILGGMTTLVGSSTNLLVSGVVENMGFPALGFFDFTLLGLMVAGIGMVYVLFVAPKILPNNNTYKREIRGENRHFFAQIMVAENSRLNGEKSKDGTFQSLGDSVSLMVIQRGETSLHRPFDGIQLQAGDELVLSGDRQSLMDIFSVEMPPIHTIVKSMPDGDLKKVLKTDEDGDDDSISVNEQSLAEAMILPHSDLVGETLCNVEFHHHTHCIVIGIERQNRVIQTGITDIPLKEGDVLLVQGLTRDIKALRHNEQVVLLDWSTEELPKPQMTRNALVIFGGVMAVSALGILPPVVAVLIGGLAMVLSGIVTPKQAFSALDTRVITLIVTALALGTALQHTGGATLITETFLQVVGDGSVHLVLGAFFLLVAIATNILSNQATAVLFAPIAVQLASALNVPIELFVVALIMAANCCFALPTGYQTNLLVMAPGHYKFTDYFKVGTPLVLIVWVSYMVLAPLYYGI